MKWFFSPAIALMNRLGYTRKFALLWLMALSAILVVVSSLFITLNKEISISQREREGLALIAPITRTVQSVQQHRGLSAMYLAGSEAVRDRHATAEKAATRDLDALERILPRKLRESADWGSIKTGWEHLQKDEFGMTAQDNLATHTRLIYDLLFFEVAVADEYALTLDPQIDTYYLIDTAISKLPAVLEHIGQLRAHGASMLAARQVAETQKVDVYKIIGMLSDVLEASGINLEKTVRYNPAMRELLLPISGTIAGAANQVAGIVESDILAGHFNRSPEDFFALSSKALDEGYRQIYESLLPATDALLKARIARAESTLYASTGGALLLLLVVGYFSAGIYFSITGNVRSLADSARAFAKGNLRERVNLDARDELGQVGDSFNEMADGFGALLAARKQAEEAVRESHDLLHSVLENTPVRIFWKDRDSRYLGCNTKFAKDAGYSIPGELAGKTDSEMGWKDQAELYRADDRAVMESGNPKLDYEEPQTTPDGNLVWLSTSKVPLRDRSNRAIGILGIYQDITARKQAEEDLREYNKKLEAMNHQLQDTQNQLVQSEKMASIGQLAAGVAHEINNPIGYVYSNLGTLEKYMQDAIGMIERYEYVEKLMTDDVARARLEAAREKLDIVFLKEDLRALMSESKDGITRVKNIVQNLKDFSHVDASDEWHFSDLHKGLDSTLNIVHNEIKYKAEVVKEYGSIPDVECLLSQLNQVFMNLLVNAAHAIEERGAITLRTGQQGEEVWVEVADTGKGIAPEHIKKIFDPFFTTKPIGKGTGLGLSLSYGIIQKHHGRIEVQSEAGKGTTFTVWLPVKQPQAEEAKP